MKKLYIITYYVPGSDYGTDWDTVTAETYEEAIAKAEDMLRDNMSLEDSEVLSDYCEDIEAHELDRVGNYKIVLEEDK